MRKFEEARFFLKELLEIPYDFFYLKPFEFAIEYYLGDKGIIDR